MAPFGALRLRPSCASLAWRRRDDCGNSSLYLMRGGSCMSSLEVPGLDVSGRVRAKDIQMAAVADVRRRVLMVSGAYDTLEHDVSICINLPETGRWQVIKSETNLTDKTWVAMQVTTDEDTHFVD